MLSFLKNYRSPQFLNRIVQNNCYQDAKIATYASILFKTTYSFTRVLPKYYADFNTKQPSEYWDYENYENTWGNQDDFEIIKKLGRGKYSEVYEAINILNMNRVVIKILKPVKKRKIRREIKILQNLKDCENIVKLLEVVKDQATQSPSLILEYVSHSDFKSLIPKLSPLDIKHYMYQTLMGLDYCHSRGIMHRDIKPQNIMVDHEKRKLKIIDWGLAEFYHPNQDYNVRVASRPYKGPELLVDDIFYDYSLDIWSTGAMLAGIIFKKDVFFLGNDNSDQLIQIVKVLGYHDLMSYIEKFDLRLDESTKKIVYNMPQKPWTSFVHKDNKEFCSEESLDLLSKMLKYDRSQRITPKDALSHPYFDEIRKMI